MNFNKPTLYLIRGIPGSGKSTFAYVLASSIHCRVLEADTYFVDDSGEYNFNPALLGEAHKYCQDSAREFLQNGMNIIVSNTSTTEREVETYAEIAKECNANFVSIIVENRHVGKNVHNVPEEKIRQMKNRFSIKL